MGIPINRSVAPVTLDPRSGLRTVEAVAGADVIHLHEPFVPVVSLAALLSSRSTPKVGTFHADPSRAVRALYRGARPAFRRLAGRLAVRTAVSEVAAAAVRDLASPLRVIPNGIEVAAYRLEAPRDPRRVLFVGRADPRKGLAVLLAAWPQVRARISEAELVVAGAEVSGAVPTGVRLLGRVPEEVKRAELAGAAVLCAPNTGGESFGMTVVEGMAAGCAVVASSLPSFRQVLGEAGVLVPPSDPDTLARALSELLGDRERVRELGERGREAAARFDWAAVLPGYLEAYERALG